MLHAVLQVELELFELLDLVIVSGPFKGFLGSLYHPQQKLFQQIVHLVILLLGQNAVDKLFHNILGLGTVVVRGLLLIEANNNNNKNHCECAESRNLVGATLLLLLFVLQLICHWVKSAMRFKIKAKGDWPWKVPEMSFIFFLKNLVRASLPSVLSGRHLSKGAARSSPTAVLCSKVSGMI